MELNKEEALVAIADIFVEETVKVHHGEAVELLSFLQMQIPEAADPSLETAIEVQKELVASMEGGKYAAMIKGSVIEHYSKLPDEDIRAILDQLMLEKRIREARLLVNTDIAKYTAGIIQPAKGEPSKGSVSPILH